MKFSCIRININYKKRPLEVEKKKKNQFIKIRYINK